MSKQDRICHYGAVEKIADEILGKLGRCRSLGDSRRRSHNRACNLYSFYEGIYA